MEDWLQGFEKLKITGCTGPGTMVGGYEWKLVFHTTETDQGTLDTINGFFQRNVCSTPQFCIEPSSGRRMQYIPMGWSGAALRPGQNGYETNRGCAIQVEIIGRAAETQDWPDEWLQFLGEFVADLVRAGAPFDMDVQADFNVPASRMSGEEWKHFRGICGHGNVPFNDHWDPGALNVARIVEFAHASLNGAEPGPAPEPGPTPEPAPEGDPLLVLGDSGADVEELQHRLAGLGYVLEADGDFGPITEAAVEGFQLARGIEDDGMVGPVTWAELAAAEAENWKVDFATLPPPPPAPVDDVPAFPGEVSLGSSGDAVTQTQQRLADRGWNLAVDGDFGPVTDDTVRQYQAEKGLLVDGIVGPDTWQSLWLSPIT